MRSFSARLGGLVVTLGLGWFLFLWTRSAWRNYWLLTDSQQGMATVTKKHWGGHGQVVYKYVVNQKEYVGTSSRNSKDPRYSKVQPGEESILYFSASHPWLSLLYKPRTFLEGWPVLIIVLPLEIFALITIIKPTSKWVFDLNDKKEDHAAS